MVETMFRRAGGFVKNLQTAKAFRFLVKVAEHLGKFGHLPKPLFPHKANAFFHGSHQQIGRGAGLVNVKKTFHQAFLHPFGIYMEQRGLGQAGEGLVQALYHNIRSAPEGRGGKLFGKHKMSAVGFIHNQRDAMGMGDVCNCLDIRDHAIIGGGGDKHASRLGKFFQGLGYMGGRD